MLQNPKILGAVLLVGLTACDSDPVGPLQSMPIMTDASLYVARPIDPPGPYQQFQFTVVARFQNLADRTLYLGRCLPDSPHPVYGLTSVNSPGQLVAYSPVCAGVGHDRDFRIEPGSTRVDTLQIVGPSMWTSYNAQPLGVLEGEFQLVYEVLNCPGAECQDFRAPDSLGVSNPFSVRVRN